MTTTPKDPVAPLMALAVKMMRDSWATGGDASWQPAYQALEASARALAAVPAAEIKYTPGEWFDATSVDQMEAFYRSRLPAIRETAKEHGYAIGVHGSLRRDLDLIAAPWREDASGADTLAAAIHHAACGFTQSKYQWEQKPAGRVAVSMPICWTHRHGVLSDGHIDLSVCPPVAQQAGGVPAGWRETAELARDALTGGHAGNLSADGQAKYMRAVQALDNLLAAAPSPSAVQPLTAEQALRDVLEAMGSKKAQELSAGDLMAVVCDVDAAQAKDTQGVPELVGFQALHAGMVCDFGAPPPPIPSAQDLRETMALCTHPQTGKVEQAVTVCYAAPEDLVRDGYSHSFYVHQTPPANRFDWVALCINKQEAPDADGAADKPHTA